MTRVAQLAIALAVSSAAGATAPAADYRLVWSDEFTVDGRPDPSNWTFEHGFVRNGEMQWYQPENARVENGLLVIEARREARRNPDFNSERTKPPFRARKMIRFTSASVTTRGLHSWKYGRFEIRARVPARQGMWPALWFVGDKGSWPAGGEIDLMEYYQDQVLANFAWASARPGHPVWQSRKIKLADLTSDPAWSSLYHLWVMEWDERQISLLLDGQLVNRIDIDGVRNRDGSAIDNPFRQPQYLIMNLALGGANGGSLSDAKLPARFEIDYVRVYQRASKGE
jgi:beta-glucanase (GH16 family)